MAAEPDNPHPPPKLTPAPPVRATKAIAGESLIAALIAIACTVVGLLAVR
jgi:hypothetical protein